MALLFFASHLSGFCLHSSHSSNPSNQSTNDWLQYTGRGAEVNLKSIFQSWVLAATPLEGVGVAQVAPQLPPCQRTFCDTRTSSACVSAFHGAINHDRDEVGSDGCVFVWLTGWLPVALMIISSGLQNRRMARFGRFPKALTCVSEPACSGLSSVPRVPEMHPSRARCCPQPAPLPRLPTGFSKCYLQLALWLFWWSPKRARASFRCWSRSLSFPDRAHCEI